MSIAVRVSVGILGALVVLSAGFAVFALIQKQSLQGQNQSLQSQVKDDESKLADLSAKAKTLQDAADQFNSKISQTQQEKAQVQSLYDDLKHKSDDLQAQLTQANADRDDWKSRVATISHQRDALMKRMKNRQTKIVYRDRMVSAPAPAPINNPAPAAAPVVVEVPSGQGDQYWGEVLKEKAALQVELEKEKSDLDQAALQVIDLKKQNSDLEGELKEVSNEKDEIVQKIKYGQDLADNLSIDLARSRNDQQSIIDRADKLKDENSELLSQIRDLTASKLGLERTVARLTDDKDAMQRKLVETESIIQSRIDDIWRIKQGLDRKLSEEAPPPASSSSATMDLPPIIVNAPNNQQQTVPQAQQEASAESYPAASPSSPASSGGKTQGSVISINEANNFAIVNLGQENSSISVGSALKVYHDSNPIADLQVIQVRRDICAADIKSKSSDLQVGDVVSFN